MVGVWQVVVDGLGYADAAQWVVSLYGLVMHLVVGVLRVVAASVEKVADVVRLEDIKQPVHVPGSLFGVFLEANLITTGAQRGSGCVLEFLNRAGFLLVKVNQVLMQDAEDAIESTVNFFNLVRVFASLLYNTSHAGVDHRGRPTGLAHQQVAAEASIGRGNRGFRFGVQVMDQWVVGLGWVVRCRVVVFEF